MTALKKNLQDIVEELGLASTHIDKALQEFEYISADNLYLQRLEAIAFLLSLDIKMLAKTIEEEEEGEKEEELQYG